MIGDEPAVAAMVEACRRGPRAAAVGDVAVSEAEDDGSADFAARPTCSRSAHHGQYDRQSAVRERGKSVTPPDSVRHQHRHGHVVEQVAR